MKLIKSMIYLAGLLTGLFVYVISKKTLPFAYQGMVHLFCITKGVSNDVLSAVIGKIKKPYDFGVTEGVLAAAANTERHKVISDLRNQGYHIFDDKLPEDLCERLLAFAISHPCNMRPMDDESGKKTSRVVYPRGNPETVRYDFTQQDLLNNPDVQNLLADLSFAAIAQDYLQSKPVLDVLAMWWHTNYSDKPDKFAAQYYHFDMDRPKWLKFFIYLTDVTPDNGPHSFISGSQKTGNIPNSMLSKGYARLTDEEVENHFTKQSIIEFSAPKGTIIAEDTRGLHKGKHVKQNDRLILQIQFSNCLFGAYYAKAKLSETIIDKLSQCVEKFPDVYSAFK
jgi:hypothetical protein